LDVDLPEYGFGIGVLHIMAAGSSNPPNIAKVRFWNAVIRAAESRFDEPFLFVGDWNTGAHWIDETGKTLVCADQFLELAEIGWTDLWRHHHPRTTEHTWFSHWGNGFRLDHAFATPSLLPRVHSCRYSHAERDAGVSDHSIMLAEINDIPMT